MTTDDRERPKDEQRSPPGLTQRLVGAAADVVEAAGDAAGGMVDEAAVLGSAAADRLRAARSKLTRGEGRLARGRRLRRLNRAPLPNLYDIHPEARVAPRRELGLLTIPVSRVVGTAVEGPAQRGSDFLPLPFLKSTNWEARWQRLRQAQDRLAILPPIDVLQAGEGYWVTDGHNRVALALYDGQDDIDAAVTHVHLPNADDADVRTGSLTPILEDSVQVRAAGAGRLTRGASARPSKASLPARSHRSGAVREPPDEKPSEP
jgi:hypothetical protein